MAQEYSRRLMKVSLAQICQNLGWNSIHATPLELLTDVLERYLLQLGRVTHRYAEQFGRCDPRLEDVHLAFGHLGVQLSELEDYIKHVEPLPFAHDVRAFPVPKKDNLQFPNPDSREIQEREDHVPAYLPYMNPNAAEEHEETSVPPPPTPEHPQQDGVSPMDISPAPGEKRPHTSPGDSGLPFKRPRITANMPEEGHQSQYQMKSVSMTQTGHLTPTRGQGKLPDAKTPPPGFKQIIVVKDGKPRPETIAKTKKPEVIKEKVNTGDKSVVPSVERVLVEKIKDKNSDSKRIIKISKTSIMQDQKRSKSPVRSKSPKQGSGKLQLKSMLFSKSLSEESKAKDNVHTQKMIADQDGPMDLSMKSSSDDSAKKTKAYLPPHLQMKEEFYRQAEKIENRNTGSQEQRHIVAEHLKMKSEEKLLKERERSAAIDDTIASVIQQSVSGSSGRQYPDQDRKTEVVKSADVKTFKTPDKRSSEPVEIWRVKEDSLSTYSDDQSISDTIESVIKASNGDKEDDGTRTDGSESSGVVSPDVLLSPTISPSKRGRKPKRGRGGKGRGSGFFKGGFYKGSSPRAKSPRGRGGSPRTSESHEGGTGFLEKQKSEEFSVYDFPDSPIQGSSKPSSKTPSEPVASPKIKAQPSPVVTEEQVPVQVSAQVVTPVVAPPVVPEVITIAMPPAVKKETVSLVEPEKPVVEEKVKEKQKDKSKEKSKDRERSKDRSKEHKKDKKKKKKKEKDKDRDRKEKHRSKEDRDMSPMPLFPKLKIKIGGSPSTPGSFSISKSEGIQSPLAGSPSSRPEIPKLKIKSMPPKPTDAQEGGSDKSQTPTTQSWVSTQIKSEPERPPTPKAPTPPHPTPPPPKPEARKAPEPLELAPLFQPLPGLEVEPVKVKEEEPEDVGGKNDSMDEDGDAEGEKVLTVVGGKVVSAKKGPGRKRRGSTRKVKDRTPSATPVKPQVKEEVAPLLHPASEISPSPPTLFPATNVPSPVTIPALKAAPPPPSPPVAKKSPPKPIKSQPLVPKEIRPPSPLFKDIPPPRYGLSQTKAAKKSPKKSSPKKSPKQVSPPVKKNVAPLFAPLSPKKESPVHTPEMSPRRGSVPRTPSPSRVSTPSPSGPASPCPIFTPGASPLRRSPSPYPMIPPTPAFPTRTISPHPSPPGSPEESVEDSLKAGQAGDATVPAMPPPSLPPMPPPSSSKKNVQRTVVAETVGSFVDASGEKIWICPACTEPDDGSPMIGCDICDDWYHWPCVNIKEEPSDDQWYCPKCSKPNKKVPKKRGRKKKKPY